MAKAKKQDATTDAPDTKPAKKSPKKADTAPAAPVEAAETPTTKPKKGIKTKATGKADATPAEAVQAEAVPTAKPAPAAKATAAKPVEPAKQAAPTKAATTGNTGAGASQPPSPGLKPFGGIDTHSAARAAASFVANRDLLGGANRTASAPVPPTKGTAESIKSDQKVESTSFKNLKQNLATPGAGLNKVLGLPTAQKKSGLPFGGSGPGGSKGLASGGGSGGNKLGVPRRTSGG